MFEKLGPDEWKMIIGWGLSAIGGICLVVLGIAGWTLKYIIDVARNTAAMAAAFTAYKNENDSEHEHIHEKLKSLGDDVKSLSAAHTEHSLQIRDLQNGRNCTG